MDAGQAVEFDAAHTLLHREAGIFRAMVEALGTVEHDRLLAAAKHKFDTN